MTNCLICMTGIDVLGPQQRDLYSLMAQKMLDGMDCGDRMPPHDRLDPPTTERCARVVEKRCGACRSTVCAYCMAAADIREAAPRIHEETDRELAAGSKAATIEKATSALCTKHKEFGHVLASEFQRRQPAIA